MESQRGEELRFKLISWIVRWNLNEEWCGEHALRTLSDHWNERNGRKNPTSKRTPIQHLLRASREENTKEMAALVGKVESKEMFAPRLPLPMADASRALLPPPLKMEATTKPAVAPARLPSPFPMPSVGEKGSTDSSSAATALLTPGREVLDKSSDVKPSQKDDRVESWLSATLEIARDHHTISSDPLRGEQKRHRTISNRSFFRQRFELPPPYPPLGFPEYRPKQETRGEYLCHLEAFVRCKLSLDVFMHFDNSLRERCVSALLKTGEDYCYTVEAYQREHRSAQTTQSLRELKKHMIWAIGFQILNCPQGMIAKVCSVSRKAVDKGTSKIFRLIKMKERQGERGRLSKQDSQCLQDFRQLLKKIGT